ncbi:uncharacterized protein [Panulirus ornatus]|uniref:uncharacterized protein n=1 Tax=Panulirus ornatus TaxID=150431 RepID=UPI003A881BD2
MEFLFDNKNCTVLGQGVYGKCYLAHMSSSKWVLKNTIDVPGNVQAMLSEIRALSVLQDCPGVQQLVMVCPETLSIITQYGGEPLGKYLARNSCSHSQVLDIALQLTDTLISIHQKGWTHLDVKIDNVTVCSSQAGLQVTLIDFGLATPIGGRRAFPKGTLSEHTAPEVLTGCPCSPQSDVYSMARLVSRLVKWPMLNTQLSKWVHHGLNVNPRHRHSLPALSTILKGLKDTFRR